MARSTLAVRVLNPFGCRLAEFPSCGGRRALPGRAARQVGQRRRDDARALLLDELCLLTRQQPDVFRMDLNAGKDGPCQCGLDVRSVFIGKPAPVFPSIIPHAICPSFEFREERYAEIRKDFYSTSSCKNRAADRQLRQPTTVYYR